MKTHLSLFSGIGGLDLAAEWAGFTTVGQCEWADYPTKVLEKHWPNVPRWKDIRTLTGESFYERTGLHTVDVISGGFPCQPFSVAGEQRGKEDDRYLWPEMVRIIKELRPTWVIGENVAGIVKMALPNILSEMEACGYRTRTFLVPACAVGARHRRYRVAIVGWYTDGRKQHKGTEQSVEKRQNSNAKRIHTDVAHSHGARLQAPWAEQQTTGITRTSTNAGNICYATGKGLPDGTGQQMERQRTPQSELKRPDSNVNRRRKGKNGSEQQWTAQSGMGGVADGISDRMDEALNYLEENAGDCIDDDDYLEWHWNDFMINEYWDLEPDVPRVAAGIPDRTGRLKALGNAVVPQQFYPFFKTIADAMEISYKEESLWKD